MLRDEYEITMAAALMVEAGRADELLRELMIALRAASLASSLGSKRASTSGHACLTWASATAGASSSGP
jgi:hypothetical protein